MPAAMKRLDIKDLGMKLIDYVSVEYVGSVPAMIHTGAKLRKIQHRKEILTKKK